MSCHRHKLFMIVKEVSYCALEHIWRFFCLLAMQPRLQNGLRFLSILFLLSETASAVDE